MALALDKCTNLIFRGKDKAYQICDKKLKQQTEVKDLDVMACGNLNWSCHIENRLIMANKVLCSLRRTVEKEVKPFTKLGLYKSLVLPVLMYVLNCAQIRRTDMVKLEKFQKAVTWILGSCHERYINQLMILNVLPLPMYIQLNDILTLAKLKDDKSEHIVFPEINELPGRSKKLFNIRETKTEKAKSFSRHARKLID